MARLCLVLGFHDTSPTAEPVVVYIGRSGAKLREAVAASPWPRHMEYPHLVGGIPKNNPRAKANLDNLVKAAAAREQAASAAGKTGA